MKKTLHAVSLGILAIMGMHTGDLTAIYRKKKHYPRMNKQLSRTNAVPPVAPPAKTDAQKKEEVALIDKKIDQSTKQLQDAVKKQKQTKTPAEKAKSNKEIIARANQVLTYVTAQRNLAGELMGYDADEALQANAVLTNLEDERNAAQAVLTKFKEQQKSLLAEGWKGWALGSIKTGKEQEYNKVTEKIKKLEPVLANLNTVIRDQSIIAGQQKFTKTRAFAAASLALAAGVTGAYLIVGPAAIKTEYNNFKDNPKKYLSDRATGFKNMLSGWLSEAPQSSGVSADVGTVITDQVVQSTLRTAGSYLGQATLGLVSETLNIGKMMALSIVAQKGMEELIGLINNKASEKEVKKKAVEVRQLQKQETPQKTK
jgi:hypothetical protein